MKYYIELFGWILLAMAFAWIGGMTRPYAAFGGEDIGALCLIGWAVHEFIEERKEARK